MLFSMETTKALLPAVLLVVIAIIFAAINFFSNGPASASEAVVRTLERVERPWMAETTDPDHGCSCVECSWMPCHAPVPEADMPEYIGSRDEIVNEIVLYWQIFFEDEDAPMLDKRRARFEWYANLVYDAVRYYQEHETDIGGRLPRCRGAFQLAASIVTFESSVNHTVVGSEPRLEVGLFQVHGRALAGYKRDAVRKNAWLGVRLGVRWLASRIPMCYPDGINDAAWNDGDWMGPMSVYAAGDNGMWNGKCLKLRVARKRIDRMIEYRERIGFGIETD